MIKKMIVNLILLCTFTSNIFAAEISDGQAFKDNVVDRPLEGESWITMVISSKGMMEATYQIGAKLKGSWQFKDGFFCREAIVNGKIYGTDCQKVILTEEGVTFIGNKGQGKHKYYKFKK
jgi:hypothetical protein